MLWCLIRAIRVECRAVWKPRVESGRSCRGCMGEACLQGRVEAPSGIRQIMPWMLTGPCWRGPEGDRGRSCRSMAVWCGIMQWQWGGGRLQGRVRKVLRGTRASQAVAGPRRPNECDQANDAMPVEWARGGLLWTVWRSHGGAGRPWGSRSVV